MEAAALTEDFPRVSFVLPGNTSHFSPRLFWEKVLLISLYRGMLSVQSFTIQWKEISRLWWYLFTHKKRVLRAR
jgi:hypothetical protein